MNMMRKISFAVLACIWAGAASAQTPDLEPLPFCPVPVGTTTWCGQQSFTVTKTDDMEMVLKLNGGRDWSTPYGMLLREDEWQYTTSTNKPFNAKFDDAAVAALKDFWPLKVGNKISVPLIEIQEWSGAPRARKIDLEVKSTAFVNVNDARYAT